MISQEELMLKTRAELVEIAKELKIAGYYRMTKDELIKALLSLKEEVQKDVSTTKEVSQSTLVIEKEELIPEEKKDKVIIDGFECIYRE
jgi:transcription termination factor Rho